MHLSMPLCSAENLIRNSVSFQSQFSATEEYYSNEFLPRAFDSRFPGGRWIWRGCGPSRPQAIFTPRSDFKRRLLQSGSQAEGLMGRTRRD